MAHVTGKPRGSSGLRPAVTLVSDDKSSGLGVSFLWGLVCSLLSASGWGSHGQSRDLAGYVLRPHIR